MSRFHTSRLAVFLLAVLFLLSNPSFAQIVPTDPGDSLVLIDLYNNTGGPSWAWQWDFSQPVTQWHGITLGFTPETKGRVIWLNLYSNNMTGAIPASVTRLTACTFFSLWHNQISGPIPDEIGALKNLTQLDLSANQLTGPIPASIGNLQQLQFLNLNDNLLSGPAPSSLGDLTQLLYLYLNNNNFNFDGFEKIYTNLTHTILTVAPQANLTIHKDKGMLSVEAGGTLSNNTYIWHNANTLKDVTIQGDKTFTPTDEGSYTVTVKNSIVSSPSGLNYSLTSGPVDVKKLVVYNLNPNPTLIGLDGHILTGTVLPLYSDVNGVAADSITKIIVTTKSDVPVTFSLSSANEGSLTDLFKQDEKPSGPLTVSPDANGRVSVIYTAPDGYGGSKQDMDGRTVVIDVNNSAGAEGLDTIHLFTPPVVLVHGMWSDPMVWSKGGFLSTLADYGIQTVERADYSEYSANTFAPYDPESVYGTMAVKEAIQKAKDDYARKRIVVTQVDIVAHSLGGLMTRSYSQQPGFTSPYNYNQGPIHKLITLGTPHRGSPLGPALWEARNNVLHLYDNGIGQTKSITLADVLKWRKMPIGSVHRDFGIESDGLHSLKATPPYKAFSITSSYLPAEADAYGRLNFLTTVFVKKPMSAIFTSRCPGTPVPSDIIVPLYSQQGYINNTMLFGSTSHSDVILKGNNETNNPDIQKEVATLLLSDDASAFSPGFPAPSEQPLDCTTLESLTAPAGTGGNHIVTGNSGIHTVGGETGKYVQITKPAAGQTPVKAGSVVTLSFQPGGGMVPDSSLFLVEGVGILPVTGATPYTTSFVMPADVDLGNINVVLLAKDTGNILYADTMHLSIAAVGSLISLSASPSPLYLDSTARSGRVAVVGTYVNDHDTTQYSIGKASAGTTYSSQKGSSVFTVSANGLITAVAPGTDTLAIGNDGLTIKVAVIVDDNFRLAAMNDNTIDFAAIPDQVLRDTPLMLDATATSGATVDFSLVSGPAELQGEFLHLTGEGMVTVRASSGGNSYFAEATPVTRSFNITKPPPAPPTGPTTATVTVGPNPGKGWFAVKVDGVDGMKEAMLTDAQGRTLRKLNLQPGQPATLQGLAAGMYILIVRDIYGPGGNFKKKVIILN